MHYNVIYKRMNELLKGYKRDTLHTHTKFINNLMLDLLCLNCARSFTVELFDRSSVKHIKYSKFSTA